MRFVLSGFALVCLVASAAAQEEVDRRLRDLEQRVTQAETVARVAESKAAGARSDANRAASYGVVAFLYAAFCALWAQNSGRNPWMWGFLGLLFTIITVIVLLVRNTEDRQRRPVAGPGPATEAPGD